MEEKSKSLTASLCESNENETDSGLMVVKTNDIETFSVNQETPKEKKGGIFDCFNDCFGLCKKKKKDSLLLKN